MTKRVFGLFVLAICVATAAGCGDDKLSELDGMYELDSWTDNPDSCDAEGPAALEEGNTSHFFVRNDEFFGQEFLAAVTCSDLQECRDMAAETDTLFLGGFLFDEGSDSSGWTGKSGFLGGENCDGEVQVATLTGEPGTAVTIERRSYVVTDVALDSEGECDFDDAYAQAESQPCATLEVVRGTYLEDL